MVGGRWQILAIRYLRYSTGVDQYLPAGLNRFGFSPPRTAVSADPRHGHQLTSRSRIDASP